MFLFGDLVSIMFQLLWDIVAHVNISQSNDLLHIPPCDIDKVKIKFNQPSPDEDPLELYRKNPDIVNTQWLFWREQRRYFYEGQIAVCFLKIGWDKWLLTTIKKITKDLNVEGGISYDGYELQEYKSYYGSL